MTQVRLIRISCCALALAVGGSAFGQAARLRLPSTWKSRSVAAIAPSPAIPSFPQLTMPLRRLDGVAPVFVDAKAGKILLQLPPSDPNGVNGRYLYQVYLRSGLGSNPVGLDRSRPGPTQVLVFREAGAKVLAEYENDGFRADAGGPDETRAVADSFAFSTVWSGRHPGACGRRRATHRRDELPHSRRLRNRRCTARGRAGRLQARERPQLRRHRRNPGLSGEPGVRSQPDFRQ